MSAQNFVILLLLLQRPVRFSTPSAIKSRPGDIRHLALQKKTKEFRAFPAYQVVTCSPKTVSGPAWASTIWHIAHPIFSGTNIKAVKDWHFSGAGRSLRESRPFWKCTPARYASWFMGRPPLRWPRNFYLHNSSYEVVKIAPKRQISPSSTCILQYCTYAFYGTCI